MDSENALHPPVLPPDEEARLRRVLGFVHEHLDSDLSVRRLAELTGWSPSCFARLFDRWLGITPHDYVVKSRVERAMDLIRDTDLSLTMIALEVGFSSQACLNVAFRRHAGVTPGSLRAARSRKAKDRGAPNVQQSTVDTGTTNKPVRRPKP